jgi:hypothetical protein
MRFLSLLLGLCITTVLTINSSAEAACSGSGQTWTCTAGSTIANVQSAINNASDGATVTFEAGSYNWSNGTISLSNSKGVTLICRTQQACDVTQGSNTMIELVFSGTNTKFYRISGFDFNGTGVCGTCIWFYGNGTLSQFRIDHNRYTGYNSSTADAAALTFLGAGGYSGQCYGVIDHNTVQSVADNMIVKNWCGQDGFNVANPDSKGTSQNVFVEDNTFIISNGGSSVACVDGAINHSTVVRYNTSTNCRGFDTHGMPHGGATNFEVYRNTMTKTAGAFQDGYRLVLNQGAGTMFVWDNVATVVGTVSANALNFIHYRDQGADSPGEYGFCDGTKSYDGNTQPTTTHRGYPCLNQPGRKEAGGTPKWGKLSPIAAFLNRTNSGTKIDLEFGCPWGSTQYCNQHVQENRDYYNAVAAFAQTSPNSPFNGTVGIGHGTLANRPTTCTHTTAPDGDNGGGVMYWATDQGTWNRSGDGRGSGILYRCSATNAWTVYYTPYTYPHPLQTSGGSTTAPPSAPTNLTVK